MAHPRLPRTSRRPLLAAGIVGAMTLLPTAALAQTVPGLDTVEDLTCSATQALLGPECPVSEVVAPVEEALGEVVGGATEAVEPVVEAVEPVVEAIEPVTEQVPLPPPSEAPPPVGGDGDPAPEAPPAPLPGEGASDEGAGTPGAPPAVGDGSGAGPVTARPSEEGGKVEAAGREPVEVAEPSGPAADGRVEEGVRPPTLPAVRGTNIPGLGTQTGLTLQPFEPPVVSVPLDGADAPMIASAASATTMTPGSPAEQAITLAGEALVASTTGVGAWATAVGLGLFGAAGYVMRRRMSGLSLEPVEG